MFHLYPYVTSSLLYCLPYSSHDPGSRCVIHAQSLLSIQPVYTLDLFLYKLQISDIIQYFSYLCLISLRIRPFNSIQVAVNCMTSFLWPCSFYRKVIIGNKNAQEIYLLVVLQFLFTYHSSFPVRKSLQKIQNKGYRE